VFSVSSGTCVSCDDDAARLIADLDRALLLDDGREDDRFRYGSLGVICLVVLKNEGAALFGPRYMGFADVVFVVVGTSSLLGLGPLLLGRNNLRKRLQMVSIVATARSAAQWHASISTN
jgi:hypothetical protein